MKISDIFEIENAKSRSFEDYDEGNIAFVSNGDYDNSILGYVDPFEGDKIFYKECICISSFCQAVIHNPPFIARGNGGSGLIILVPKNPMSKEELFFYSAQINLLKWRFSYNRMVIKQRIKDLELVPFEKISINIDDEINKLLPVDKRENVVLNSQFKYFKIEDICDVFHKSYDSLSKLDSGTTPYVTTTSFDNGVKGFVNEESIYNKFGLSIALNGSVGEVFFQVDDFISSSDNAVLYLKKEFDSFNPYLLFYIGAVFKIHKWRYNYYRKLKLGELKSLEVPIPIKNNEINIEYIISLITNSYSWDIIEKVIL